MGLFTNDQLSFPLSYIPKKDVLGLAIQISLGDF